jgi:aerobic carbon-monoxide dehydrogenase large subunit
MRGFVGVPGGRNKDGQIMAYRRTIGAAAVASALLITCTAAQAFDDSKYPDLSGQWVAVRLGVQGQPAFDPTKPWGLGQQAPLTPEYQKVLEASIAAQAKGNQGNWLSGVSCLPTGMPAMMTLYRPMEIMVLPDTTYIRIDHTHQSHRRIFTDGRPWPKEFPPSFPHVVRLLMGNFVLNIPQHKLRVVAPDVGGGFGVKQFHYAEEAVITWAAAKLGRPIKWVCERSEGFVSDAQGRDHVTEAELALDETGKFLGLRVSTIANLGGYISTFGPNIPTNLYGPLLAGVYTTPAIYCEVKVVFTNTVPVDAYRGAGRPEATFVLERLVDIAASDMGIDKAEIRRRNMIPKEAYPYQTPVLVEYDSGDPRGCLDQALVVANWAGFAERKAESARNGKLRGIGLSTYVEACGLAPSRIAGRLGARGGLYESATVRVHPTGQVTVLIGTHNHGQGHETTFAQIVSDKLGVPFESVDIVFGDTDRVQFGMGTYGSRSLVVGGAALSKASDKVIAKGKKIAAHLLESSEQDIEFEAGVFSVAGTDRKKSFGEVARAAYVPHDYPLEVLEPGLEEQAYYDPVNFTYPGGAHVAEVEVDPDTCMVRLVNYTAVDDVGTVINPMIVEGQLHGGIVQGIGQALFENCIYDDVSGQLLSGSFMDYCMPRADNLPHMTIETHSTSCAHTPMGVKGCGEVGTIGSPAAVANAVVDALAHLGVNHVDMPASANRLWQIIQSASLLRGAE